jgi:hypothetical protein
LCVLKDDAPPSLTLDLFLSCPFSLEALTFSHAPVCYLSSSLNISSQLIIILRLPNINTHRHLYMTSSDPGYWDSSSYTCVYIYHVCPLNLPLILSQGMKLLPISILTGNTEYGFLHGLQWYQKGALWRLAFTAAGPPELREPDTAATRRRLQHQIF